METNTFFELDAEGRVAGSGHDSKLRGASFLGPSAGPVILERTDQRFLPSVLKALESDRGRRALRDDLAVGEGEALSLYQPVHRTFHPVLLEAFCDRPGWPRLDPSKIESAGLVIRRLDKDGREQRWASVGEELRGWVTVRGDGELDPDPKRRPRSQNVPERLQRRLAALAGSEASEATTPLFVAPPEACRAAGATILYALCETASDQISEAPTAPPSFDTETFDRHLTTLLKNQSDRAGYSWLGSTLTPANVAAGSFNTDLNILRAAVEQLAVEFGAFGDDAEARALITLLDRIRLPFRDGSTRGAGQILRGASDVLLSSSGAVSLPVLWPAIAAGLRAEIAEAARGLLDARLAAITPGAGRFSDHKSRYRLRAFARIRQEDGCPPRLVWSAPSESFTIKPWYAAGASPPVRIDLPDPTDLDALKALTPSVAVSVPKGLQDLLHGVGIEDLLDGKKGQGTGLDVDWVCGFNLPTITLCAFLVLSLFLKLFNILFFWLPFVKICIPIPRITDS